MKPLTLGAGQNVLKDMKVNGARHVHYKVTAFVVPIMLLGNNF